MKKILILIFTLFSILSANPTLDSLIKKADQAYQNQQLDQAVKTMEEASVKYPQDFRPKAYLGYYQGLKAGEAAETDVASAGMWLEKCFNSFESSAKIDSSQPLLRFLRGTIFVNIPDFFGKKEQGMIDLEFALSKFKSEPKDSKMEEITACYYLLGQCYSRKMEYEKAILLWKEVDSLYKENPELYNLAQKNLKELESKKEKVKAKKAKVDIDLENELKKFNAYMNKNQMDSAEICLNQIKNAEIIAPEVYKAWLYYYEKLVGLGYDEQIYDNQNFRSEKALEMMKVLDQAITHFPQSVEFRMLRGMIGIDMPFFLKRLDQGISDLEYIIDHSTNDSIIDEAKFYLGRAYQRKGMGYWTHIIAKNDTNQIAERILSEMSKPFSNEKKPEDSEDYAEIVFSIPFQDQIQPQVALWIENEKGEYLRTLYVSGFSKYVKEKQVVLPDWAKSSNFENIDAVSCASIDMGRHTYYWDLKDSKGKLFKKGKFNICLEICHWPTVKHEFHRILIDLKKDDELYQAKGKYISRFEVKIED